MGLDDTEDPHADEPIGPWELRLDLVLNFVQLLFAVIAVIVAVFAFFALVDRGE